jgi:hypothetical protein
LTPSDGGHAFYSAAWSHDVQNLAMGMATASRWELWIYNVARGSALLPTRINKVTNLTHIKTATDYDEDRDPLAWR